MSIKIVSRTKTHINTEDTTYHFKECFNIKNFTLFRSNIFKDGKESGEQPFNRSFPYYISFGIVGNCNVYSDAECDIDCFYRRFDRNLSIYKISEALKEMYEKGTLRIELTGYGDPDTHPDINKILEKIHEYRMGVELTTSGYSLTNEVAILCKKFNVTVNLSWHGKEYSISALQKLIDNKCRYIIYLILTKDNVNDIINIIKTNELTVNDTKINLKNLKTRIEINPFVPFKLEYKDKALNINNDENIIKELYHSVATNPYIDIYLDQCSVPGLFTNHYTFCKHGRMSAIITPDFTMAPCHYLPDLKYSAISLNNYSIEQAWNSELFNNFKQGLCIENNISICPIYTSLKEAGVL